MMARQAAVTGWRAAALLAALLACSSAALAHVPAKRIVSINLCADALLLGLADREHISALTLLSRDPRNFPRAGDAAGLPAIRGRAEEVVALEPDLVLASTLSTPSTISMLRRLGVPLMQLDVAQDFPAIRAQLHAVGAAVGRPERADAAIVAMDRRLADLARDLPVPPLSAIAMQANNIVAGSGTLADTVIRAAGLTNAAARAGIAGHGRLSLEAVLALAPDVLIVDGEENTAPARANRLLRHPALVALTERGTRTLTVPSRLWVCGGPDLVEAVALLRRSLQRES